MIHHEGLRRFIVPVVLLFVFGISMAGCGGGNHHDSSNPAPDPVSVQITVDGTTYTYNKGPVQKPNTSFMGIASGSLYTIDSTTGLVIYGSELEASDAVSDSIFGPNGACLFIIVERNATSAPGTYSNNIDGGWRKDALSQTVEINYNRVTIDEFGDVGGRIKGTFAGTYTDAGGNTKAVTGSFNVQRFPDDDFQQYFL